jgi:hypothetical protein
MRKTKLGCEPAGAAKVKEPKPTLKEVAKAKAPSRRREHPIGNLMLPLSLEL